MEPLTIILGVALILVAAYAADRNETVKSSDSRYWAGVVQCENLEESNACLTQELIEAKELRAHLEEQLAKANSELVVFHIERKNNFNTHGIDAMRYRAASEDLKRRREKYANLAREYGGDPQPFNQGQKPAEVIKIELGDDFKELKAAVDSIGSVNVLKTELDRAHKREAIYMKRLLVSNAAILAASKKA